MENNLMSRSERARRDRVRRRPEYIRLLEGAIARALWREQHGYWPSPRIKIMVVR